jgi:hypothetical protein
MAYEYLGFAGFGPNRNAIRLEPLRALVGYAFPLLLFTLLWLGLLICGLRFWPPRSLTLYGFFLLPGAFMIAIGYFENVRVLPRHLTPLMPLVVYFASRLLAECWTRGAISRYLVAVFLLTSLASSYQIRFSARHRRDDYRHAAMLAKRERLLGNQVLWEADVQNAIYYGVIRSDERDTGCEMVLLGDGDLPRRAKPNSIVLFSKPDIYDRGGRVRRFLDMNNYRLEEQFAAFQLWRSPLLQTKGP